MMRFGDFSSVLGGIGVGLVECMLPNPEIAGIVPAPNRPWDIEFGKKNQLSP